jgi:hypothetical protein
MTDLLDMLHRLDPVDKDALAKQPVPQEPLRQALAGSPTTGSWRKSARRRRGALATALIGGLVATVLLAVLPDGQRSSQRPAGPALLAVARAAQAQPTEASSGRYAYTRLEDTSLGTFFTDPPFSVLIRRVEERWIAPDGTGRLLSTPKPLTFPSPRDKERWEAAGRPSGASEREDSNLDATDLGRSIDPALPPINELPNDPNALHALMREAASHAGAPTNVRTFELVGELLGHAATAPRLRAALFTVASQIDGIERVGATRDPLGRPGQAVAIRSDYSGSLSRQLLIYDPANAQLLASRTDLLEPAAYTGGPTVSYRVLVAAGMTGSPRERP